MCTLWDFGWDLQASSPALNSPNLNIEAANKKHCAGDVGHNMCGITLGGTGLLGCRLSDDSWRQGRDTDICN